MAIPSESITSICGHCEREIPASNIDLHYAHCLRNLEKCTICTDMIPKKHAAEHYDENHAPVVCPLCNEKVERDAFPLHKGERCMQRIITCEYCELPLPAIDLYEHQEICGNRTEACHICHKYVRLRERIGHEIQHSTPVDVAESSSRGPDDRGQNANRRPVQGSSKRQILLTIAIAGVAFLAGTFLYQRKIDVDQH